MNVKHKRKIDNRNTYMKNVDALPISGTFLDEISHDIPHQNWGYSEWEKDFRSMKNAGIDTVIMIRCGMRRWMTYPSKILSEQENCHMPSMDLVKLFLTLSEKYSMSFYFGTYDSNHYWEHKEHEKEIELSMRVAEEVWKLYGSSTAFKGWYLCWETDSLARTPEIASLYSRIGRHCKELSGGLPVVISPYIDGCKNVSQYSSQLKNGCGSISTAQHEKDWDFIMSTIKGAVDVVAFQDGHVEFSELKDFLTVNKKLADRHGLRCWTNSETFDRDMPIKFLPIKWEKLLLKLKAAKEAGIEKAITFEFSHFMSPNSCYLQAHGLYGRHAEYFGFSDELYL